MNNKNCGKNWTSSEFSVFNGYYFILREERYVLVSGRFGTAAAFAGEYGNAPWGVLYEYAANCRTYSRAGRHECIINFMRKSRTQETPVFLRRTQTPAWVAGRIWDFQTKTGIK